MGIERFKVGDMVACLATGFITVGIVAGSGVNDDGAYVTLEHFRNDESAFGNWSPEWLVNGTDPSHRIEWGCYSRQTVDRVRSLAGNRSLDEPELWALIEKVRGRA